MIILNKKQSTVVFIIVLLVTLFFGLKPKGYRFVNQVKPIAEKSGLEFPNIGMMYSEKPMGAIGITDSMAVLISIRPFNTGKRLSKIVTFIDGKGNELLALEQWTNAVIATLYDSYGKKVAKTEIHALSKDSISGILITISGKTMEFEVGNTKQKETVPEGVITRAYFSHARMTIGLSPTGQNPFKGVMYGLVLFNHAINLDSLEKYHLSIDKNVHSEIILNNQPAAFFDFSGIIKRKVCDISGNRWDLCVPAFPRIFKYKILQPINSIHGDKKSFASDIIVNFLGFLPFGAAAYLFFFARIRKATISLVYMLIISSFMTIFIETSQIFIPTRESQISDIMLNIAGAAAGAVVVFFAIKRFRKFFFKTQL